MDDDRPIFRQVAALLEQSVVDGSLPEEAQVPSTADAASVGPALNRAANQVAREAAVWIGG